MIGVAIVAVMLVILIRRWRAATPPQRRVAGADPVVGRRDAGAARRPRWARDAAGISRLTDVLGWASLLVFASVPWVFLIGLVRSRVARAGAVSRAAAAARRGARHRHAALPARRRARRPLAAARLLARGQGPLGRLRRPRGRAAGRGRPRARLDAGRARGPPRRARSCTTVTLCEDPELLGSVAAAAGLAMENERLQAQLRARVEELRTSRARIVEAGTHERRRLERNLHDGAQQRLVALSLTLRLAQGKIAQGPREGRRAARRRPAGADAARSSELRELARGIHPAVLSDRGLGAALEALAGRAPLAGRARRGPGRAAARADRGGGLLRGRRGAHQRRQVRPREPGHRARAAAQRPRRGRGRRRRRSAAPIPDRGSGLRGLADRVRALDGRMSLDSPPGRALVSARRYPYEPTPLRSRRRR